MQVPKSRRKQKLREKKCLYKGCGKVFFGIHITKYCTEHRQDCFRIRVKKKPEDINVQNQTFTHSYSDVTTMVSVCALEGCNIHFEVSIYPRQFIYPKYCTGHRNEFKRIHHLNSIGREDLVEHMKKEKETINIENTITEGVKDQPKML